MLGIDASNCLDSEAILYINIVINTTNTKKTRIVDIKAEIELFNLNLSFNKYIRGLVVCAIMNAIINGIVKEIVFIINIKEIVKIIKKIKKCLSCFKNALLNNIFTCLVEFIMLNYTIVLYIYEFYVYQNIFGLLGLYIV